MPVKIRYKDAKCIRARIKTETLHFQAYLESQATSRPGPMMVVEDTGLTQGALGFFGFRDQGFKV